MPVFMKGARHFVSVSALLLSLGVAGNAMALAPVEEDYELKLLGKFIFFDNISSPAVQSCSSCHVPSTGGTGGDSMVNLTQVAINGADVTTVGHLKPPTNAYATLIRDFALNPQPQPPRSSGLPQRARMNEFCFGPTGYCGGNFWNGRSVGAEGEVQLGLDGNPTSTHVITDAVIPDDLKDGYIRYLGPTADQALNPFPNHVEQNVAVSEAEAVPYDDLLPGAEAVCAHVKNSVYAFLYQYAWGEPIDCGTESLAGSERAADISFQRIAVALAAYQDSSEINSFSSKRDYALGAELACLNRGTPEFWQYAKYFRPAVCNHPDYVDSPGKFPLAGFNDEENRGHDLFYGLQSARFNPAGKNAQCTECHVSNKEAGIHTGTFDDLGNEYIQPDGTDLFERYTDDSFHVIGTPANPEISSPECAPDADPSTCRVGLGGHIFKDGTGFFSGPLAVGNRKVPTLRNVDKRPYPGFVKAYGANGWFKSLEGIIHFYNTALIGNCDLDTDDNGCTDRGERAIQNTTAYAFGITRCEARAEGWTEAQAIAANCWPDPEFNGAPFGLFIGDLHLDMDEEAALVAYMKTFTDTVTAIRPTVWDLFAAKLKHRLEERRSRF